MEVRSLHLAFVSFRHALNDHYWVGRRAEPLGEHFEPIHLALLRFEREPVLIARRIELAGDFARWRNRLCDFRAVVCRTFRQDGRASEPDEHGIRNMSTRFQAIMKAVDAQACWR